MGPTWIALAPVFLATACMLLSVIGLVGIIARHHYGSGSTRIVDACRTGNMKPALILFYALVLTQGALFLIWFVVAVIRSGLAAELKRSYLGGLSADSRKQTIDRYVSNIADSCIQKGVARTINTNLVSFAEELLLQSQHPNDHLTAVLVLHQLVIEKADRSDGAVMQICSSEKLVSRLLLMLRPNNDLGLDNKPYIAEVIAKLASKLRLEDIPGAARSISSLLDPHLLKKKNYQRPEMNSLFVQGLLILGELAADPENCTEIYNTMDLVPKIIAPVRDGLHLFIKNDPAAKMVEESLCVISKLTSRTAGESGRKLCNELTAEKYGGTAKNILWILTNSRGQDLRMQALRILSRLTLDQEMMPLFTAKLRDLLHDSHQLSIEAGKALIARGRENEFPEIGQLVEIMSADGHINESRAVAADMLALICAKSTAEQGHINRLRSVANALPTVLNAVVATVTTGITDLKFLASFLGLAVQIREKKLVTAEAFADAVTAFAEKLETIIERMTYNESEDEACLAIMKSAAKLVTWMADIDTIKEYFGQKNIPRKLDETMRRMVHLDLYVVMTGGADENERYVTLRTLVETAGNKFVSAQWQRR